MHVRPLLHAATLAASALLPFAARAQDTTAVEVRPGNPLLNTSRIAARTDTFELRVEDQEPIELVIRTTAVGDTALLRVERMNVDGTELNVDSFAVRRSTLAPLFAETRGALASSRLTFPAGRVEGTVTPRDDAERTVSESLTAPTFYSNSVDMVLAALPLEAGRSFSLGMWAPSTSADDLQARVVRAETAFTADGGRCDAWRVESTDAEGQTSVYWLERGTHSLLAYSARGMEIRIAHHPGCPRASGDVDGAAK